MQEPVISLITVSFNAERTIERCIQSVIAQTYKKIEYIIIDGGSSDNTVQIINKYSIYISRIISEPDKGIYDAMNKGIRAAQGQVIGILNADDIFAANDILEKVAGSFAAHPIKLLYGDLDVVNATGKVVRKWRSGNYLARELEWGWMPPHPTFYCERELYHRYGLYSLDYGTAADYELMLRLMLGHGIPAFYLPQVMVKMEVGGESNKNLESRLSALRNDYLAMKNNGLNASWLKALIKRVRKISQFF